MLSMSAVSSGDFVSLGQQSSGIGSLIQRTSSNLAKCEKQEIETIIRQSIADVSAIECVEQAGWFLLTDSGVLTEVFHSTHSSIPSSSALRGGLRELPWCLAQLNAGNAVLIYDTSSLFPAAELDQMFLKAAEIHSLAIVPSNSASLGRTVMMLSSDSSATEWPDGLVEQCTLLQDIFSNAYQRGLAQNESQVNIKEAELSRRQTEVGFLASLLIQSQENERKRLSRELHDDIGQRLSLAASEVALMVSQQSTASLDRLICLRDELDSLCTDVHEMSHDLHSYKLQHLGLKSALKDLCRRLSQPNFRVDLYADEFEEPSSKEVSLCLYRVAQESLNNALKHAHTMVVAMTITKLQGMFYLTIQDAGIGFDSSVNRHGLGLVSMSERIKLVNGDFRLHSVPGRGTELWIAVPDQPGLIERRSYEPEVRVA